MIVSQLRNLDDNFLPGSPDEVIRALRYAEVGFVGGDVIADRFEVALEQRCPGDAGKQPDPSQPPGPGILPTG